MNIFYPPEQERIFLIMLIFGFVLGLFYDLFRIKRHIFGISRIVLFIDDVIFSLFSVLAFLMVVFAVNNGLFRWYEVFFTIIGFGCYVLTVSRIVLFISYKLVDLFLLLFKKILKLLFYPLEKLLFFVKVLLTPFFYSCVRAHKMRMVIKYMSGITL